MLFRSKLGAQFAEDEVERVEDGGPGAPKRVICAGETYEARALILAMRQTGLTKEEALQWVETLWEEEET